MTNSDKHNNLFAHAQLQNSVNKAQKHKKEHQKRPICGVSTNHFDIINIIKL